MREKRNGRGVFGCWRWYRIRATRGSFLGLALFRPPAVVGSTSASEGPNEVTETNDITQELIAIWGIVDAPGGPYNERVHGGMVSRESILPQPIGHLAGRVRSSTHDILGPLSPRYDLEATSPLYKITAESLQWDPASQPRTDWQGRSGSCTADGHSRDRTRPVSSDRSRGPTNNRLSR